MQNSQSLQRVTGGLFILGSLLVNLPYTLLIINFEYPQILRQEPGQILTKFQEGGPALIFQWFGFAWIGLPILVAVILLQRLLSGENAALVRVATTFGIVGLIAQVIGLLRWVFVVPVLASIYTAPGSSPATRETVGVVFKIVNQFGGVLLGEHLGQLLIIVWMVLISLLMFKSALFKPWLGWFGLVASAVYLLAQGELFATVIPGFPVLSIAGLVGSLLWLGWMVLVGIFLLRARPAAAKAVEVRSGAELYR